MGGGAVRHLVGVSQLWVDLKGEWKLSRLSCPPLTGCGHQHNNQGEALGSWAPHHYSPGQHDSIITFRSPACWPGYLQAVYKDFLKLGGRGPAQRR